MEKRTYLQPETKILSISAYSDVCETGIMVDSDNMQEELYGPPGIFDESPLF